MFRAGLGFDVHAFADPASGRPLVLGGVAVPHGRGLQGHSDADVLAHAVGDAVLGAAALGDLGLHFPDTDPRWKGIASLRILESCVRMARDAGFAVVNVDATVIAEEPKIAPHAAAIRANLARALGVPEGSVGVKATRPEGLGSLGRREGIAALAVALLERRGAIRRLLRAARLGGPWRRA